MTKNIMKHINNTRRMTVKSSISTTCAMLLLLISLVVGCSDEPDQENYYTTTREMITDYLQNRSDRYSEFIYILQRAEIYDLLSTYGEFTCLAPTNSAISSYLEGRGMSSLAELTKEDCDTIAYTHLIKQTYFTTDLNDGAIPTTTMSERYLTISSDTLANSQIAYYINKTARLITRDDSVENGVVHTVNQIISPSNDMLPDLLSQDEDITIFYGALVRTGLVDSLKRYINPNYVIGEDSVINGVYYHTGNEYEYAFYPSSHRYAYTVFAEPDSIYANYGIQTVDQLEGYAKSIYDTTYPQDAGLYDNDPTHRKNPLNRFVAYHILDRLGNYNELNVTGDVKNQMHNLTLLDVNDYYETMCPFTIMQVTSPSEGMFINRRGVGTNYQVRGTKVGAPSDTQKDQGAINGVYHYIDDILTYNTNVRDYVLNVRMRFDASTTSPEFMTSGARGRAGYDQCTGFKNGFLSGWKFTDETLVSCRNRHTDFDSYQGDEVVLLGQYDFTFKLPPVPEGTYEIRLGYCAMATRGIVQAYFDGQPCGIPLDLRIFATNPKIGWQTDVANQETNQEQDKALRNRGYMKGPRSVRKYAWGSYHAFRAQSQTFRRILTTTYISDDKDHYLRFKLTLDNPRAEFAFDYYELCPKSVYDGELGDDGN